MADTPATPVTPAPAPAAPKLEDRFAALVKHLADHGIHFKG
jgi:hypothetical protein